MVASCVAWRTVPGASGGASTGPPRQPTVGDASAGTGTGASGSSPTYRLQPARRSTGTAARTSVLVGLRGGVLGGEALLHRGRHEVVVRGLGDEAAGAAGEAAQRAAVVAELGERDLGVDGGHARSQHV